MNYSVEVGRRVFYEAGVGCYGGEGVITHVEHGIENVFSLSHKVNLDKKVDVALDDGRLLQGLSFIDLPGIGIKTLPSLVSEEQALAALNFCIESEKQEKLAAERQKKERIAAQATIVIENEPVFFWNGIKDKRGDKLQRAHYSVAGNNDYHPAGSITVYARDYSGFSDLVRECFSVKNDTDSMTDYFDTDKFVVFETHPLYAKVKEAADKYIARYRRN